MGYGSHALQLLIDYYHGKFPSLTEGADEGTHSQIDSSVEVSSLSTV